MDERHLPASEKHRQKALEQGDGVHSKDAVAAVIIASGGFALLYVARSSSAVVIRLLQVSFGNVANPSRLNMGLSDYALTFVKAASPVLVCVMVAVVAAELLQRLGHFQVRSLTFDFNKLNPAPRLARLFGSKESLLTVLQSALKIVLLAIVIGWVCYDRFPDFLRLSANGLAPILVLSGDILFTIFARSMMLFVALGVADYGLQRFLFEQRIRMTHQEAKEEAREDAGDPAIRQRRRRRMRELLASRSLKSVPKADVIVTNPTHFAVAILYQSQKMGAPRIVAKGADAFAERIRAVARKHSVPVIENPPLTRALYKRVAVGKEIPPDLFQAVAIVLAHVYRLKRRMA